jgi:tetratricopeptide (TPR) repeat protein
MPPLSDDDVAVCYLCLDGGADEAGQPLLRDCACRGTDAGFVHLACLTKYAETKSMQASDMIEFRVPWRDCPSCHQEYQNELRIDIATDFVSFVRRQYPNNTQRQVEALYLKLRALDSMFDRLPVQKKEVGVTANVLLSLIDRMKNDASLLPERYLSFQADAYNAHGLIAIFEGTDESARRAVAYFENQLEVFEAIGFARGVATAKSNIAFAKSKYEGGSNEEVLKAFQELYELRIAEHGDEDEYTILAGKIYAIRLQKANRREEAIELLTKLLVTSKQVLGPHHNTTKEVASALKWINFITFIKSSVFD